MISLPLLLIISIISSSVRIAMLEPSDKKDNNTEITTEIKEVENENGLKDVLIVMMIKNKNGSSESKLGKKQKDVS